MYTFLLNAIAAEDIRLSQGSVAAEILKESKEVIQTKGEWELIDIQVAPAMLEITYGSYSELKYFVSIFSLLLYSDEEYHYSQYETSVTSTEISRRNCVQNFLVSFVYVINL